MIAAAHRAWHVYVPQQERESMSHFVHETGRLAGLSGNVHMHVGMLAAFARSAKRQQHVCLTAYKSLRTSEMERSRPSYDQGPAQEEHPCVQLHSERIASPASLHSQP